VERVQETILDECWKPAFARYLIPKYTGLRLDLDPLPDLLQHRPRAYRTVDEGADPGAGHREGEDVVSIGTMRRHISVTGQINSLIQAAPLAGTNQLEKAL